mmetsp:Transcript_6081/g.20515  ORF Transcript_6081/g.20515 Transcript_6081/m.20515 type:complete len:228 (+) Transcript_6081:233-916(+)
MCDHGRRMLCSSIRVPYALARGAELAGTGELEPRPRRLRRVAFDSGGPHWSERERWRRGGAAAAAAPAAGEGLEPRLPERARILAVAGGVGRSRAKHQRRRRRSALYASPSRVRGLVKFSACDNSSEAHILHNRRRPRLRHIPKTDAVEGADSHRVRVVRVGGLALEQNRRPSPHPRQRLLPAFKGDPREVDLEPLPFADAPTRAVHCACIRSPPLLTNFAGRPCLY